jgi:hypothetical protein
VKDKSRKDWVRLDNASKIFPATSNNKDTKVFRLSCELKDDVDPAVLQEALDQTIKVFPHYSSVMRRGIFWYYLEEENIDPIVTKEQTPVCAPLYVHEERNLLFRVMYYRRRVSLEVFHALADGTGGIWFFQVLIHYYLLLRYPHLQRMNIVMPIQGSLAEKMADGYSQFSGRESPQKAAGNGRDAADLTRLEKSPYDKKGENWNWLQFRGGKIKAMSLPPHKATPPVADADQPLDSIGKKADSEASLDSLCVGEECRELLVDLDMDPERVKANSSPRKALEREANQSGGQRGEELALSELRSALTDDARQEAFLRPDESVELASISELDDLSGDLRAAPDLNAAILRQEFESETADSVSADESEEEDEALKELDEISTSPEKKRLPKAYRIKGRTEENNRMSVLEGCMPLQQMLDLAHRYDVTLTVFQVALFIYSIGMDIPGGQSRHPITVSVPVDLRQRFPSLTARNFFATILITYYWRQVPVFENLVEEVKRQFERELQPDSLKRLLKKQSALSRNPIVRLVPINVKDYVLRLAHRLSDRNITAAVSNVGKIKVDPAMSDYIYQFSVLTSVRRPQFCSVSFADRMVITFTSPMTDMEIQRHFFNFLTKCDVKVTISSNVNRKPDTHNLTMLDGVIADKSVKIGEELHAEIL